MAESYYIPEDPTLQDESERLRKILDAKYEAALPAGITAQQTHLDASEQSQLKELLTKHESLFDGTLGKWTGTKVELELKPEQSQLKELLMKHEAIFDGSLGKWTGTKVEHELKPDVKPYHAKAYPVPRCHMESLKHRSLSTL